MWKSEPNFRSQSVYTNKHFYTLFVCVCIIISREHVQRRFLKNGVHMLTGSYPPRGYPNDLLLRQLGMSSLLSRRDEHSVVFLFKLIKGLVDCSDLLSQVTFKVNRPACRTKNTFFLPTRHTNTYWTLVAGCPDDEQLSEH
jgi:hypothetical protein